MKYKLAKAGTYYVVDGELIPEAEYLASKKEKKSKGSEK